MEKIAKIISFLFFPLFMPIYGLSLLFSHRLFSVYPMRYIHAAFLVTFMCCILLPLCSFYVLKALKVISDVKMYEKEERVVPLTFAAVFFFICSYELYLFAMPLFVVNIAIGTAVATLLVAIISRWWKISGHMTGIGALTSSIFVMGLSTYTNTSVVLCCAFFISGLVASARYTLKRHSFEQLAAGFANGFLTILLFSFSNISNLFRLL